MAMEQLNQMMDTGQVQPAGMQGAGVDAESRGGMQTEDPSEIPGAEDLTPEQLKQIKAVSLMTQQVISDPQSGKPFIEQASTGDQGLAAAISGLLKIINDKLKLPDEMIVPAAVTILIILYKFLSDIGKASGDPQEMGSKIGMVAMKIGTEYGIDPASIQQMVGQQGGEMEAGPEGSPAEEEEQGPLGQAVRGGR